MTLDTILTELRTLAIRWQGEAQARLKVWSGDPIGLAYQHAAAELQSEITRLTHESARVTVQEYAEMRGVSPQCVRRWIRNGYLPASKTRDGYSIARTARVIRRVA